MQGYNLRPIEEADQPFLRELLNYSGSSFTMLKWLNPAK
jgi:hypothetical protein